MLLSIPLRRIGKSLRPAGCLFALAAVFPTSAAYALDYTYIRTGTSAGWTQNGGANFNPSGNPGSADNLILLGDGTTVAGLNLASANRAVAHLESAVAGAQIAGSGTPASLTIHQNLTINTEGASLTLRNGSSGNTMDVSVLGDVVLTKGDLYLGLPTGGGDLKSFSVSGTTTVSAALYNRYTNATGIGFGDLVVNQSGSVTLMYKANYATGSASDHFIATVGARSLGGGGTIIGSDIATPGTRNATLAVQTDTASNATFSGQLQDGGSGSRLHLTLSGDGRQTLTGINTYTGATTLSEATLILSGSGSINTSSGLTLSNGGTLVHNADTALSVPLTVTHGTVSGSGTIQGDVTIGAGATLSPGNSPGSQTYDGNQTWLAGGNYNWQIHDADSTPGLGFDTLEITGTLDLSALSAENRFNLNLWSLSAIGPDENGNALHFDAGLTQSWLIATTDGIVYNTTYAIGDLFAIHQDAFNGTGGFLNTAPGSWSVVTTDGTDLLLRYAAIPEPRTFLLLLPAALWLMQRHRRTRMG